jgi:hypothetical protein
MTAIILPAIESLENPSHDGKLSTLVAGAEAFLTRYFTTAGMRNRRVEYRREYAAFFTTLLKGYMANAPDSHPIWEPAQFILAAHICYHRQGWAGISNSTIKGVRQLVDPHFVYISIGEVTAYAFQLQAILCPSNQHGNVLVVRGRVAPVSCCERCLAVIGDEGFAPVVAKMRAIASKLGLGAAILADAFELITKQHWWLSLQSKIQGIASPQEVAATFLYQASLNRLPVNPRLFSALGLSMQNYPRILDLVGIKHRTASMREQRLAMLAKATVPIVQNFLGKTSMDEKWLEAVARAIEPFHENHTMLLKVPILAFIACALRGVHLPLKQLAEEAKCLPASLFNALQRFAAHAHVEWRKKDTDFASIPRLSTLRCNNCIDQA